MLHYGDIKQYDFWPLPEERKWGGGAVINYQVSPIFSLQLQGLHGNLAGVKRNFRATSGTYWEGNPANYKFEAELYEGTFNATISLNRWFTPNLKLNDWLNFYALGGVGLIQFRTQLRDLKDDTFINSYGWKNKGTEEADMTTETVFPVGLGVKIKLHDKIDLNIESTIRNLNSDKLDAYIRHNNAKDKYGYTFIGFTYRFGKRSQHMEWLDPAVLEREKEFLALEELQKDVQKLKQRIADVDELKRRIEALENRIAATPEEDVKVTDLRKLEDLRGKLSDLEERNIYLNERIQKITVETETVTRIDGVAHPVLISVFFEVNKSNIDKINAERVAAAAKLLNADPNITMTLVGHADRTGGQRYNELLSERRARSVYNSLVNEYGIDASRLSISYRGFKEPLSKTNFDVNRRVDFIID